MNYFQGKINNVILIGSGNVATHLGLVLKECECRIVQVYSRNEASAKRLAGMLSAGFTAEINNINAEADIYIIAVKDEAIRDIALQLNISDRLVVHTSGSVSAGVLKNASVNYGVFYPLQTFSKTLAVNGTDIVKWFKQVPICIEGNTIINENRLLHLASSISENVKAINSRQRQVLHLAAVFACNFSNHMYAVAEDILKKENLPFELLKPLIIETACKIKRNSPGPVQTGPAVREDKRVMDEHLKYLSELSGYKELYKLISKSIKNIRR